MRINIPLPPTVVAFANGPKPSFVVSLNAALHFSEAGIYKEVQRMKSYLRHADSGIKLGRW